MDKSLRERIEVLDEKYAVLNTSLLFAKDEIQKLINEHPEKFSPNVILRPVYQELILPNLAYVGGPAEVAYWLQLKGVFDYYQVPFPLIFPRLFAMVINKANAKKIEKLELMEKDLFEDFNLLKQQILSGNNGVTYDLSEQICELEKVFDGIRQKAGEVDKSLEGFILSEYKKVEKGIENIQKRLKKAEEQREEVKINQLKGLLDKLFPDGNPQEREDNFLNFFINNPAFIDILITMLDPFQLKYNILLEDA